jgi:hypothetical protein
MYEHLILAALVLANIGLVLRMRDLLKKRNLIQKDPIQKTIPNITVASGAIIACLLCGKDVARYNAAGVCANCAPAN